MLISKMLACAALVCILIDAFSARAQATLSAEQQALIAADRGILDAMSGPQSNVEKVSQFLAPEYMDVEDGASHSRAEVLQWEARRTNFSYQYDNPQATVLSPTSGYVIADVHYSQPYHGAPESSHKLMTTAFVLREGRWLATLHEEIPIDTGREDVLATPADSNPSLIAMRKLSQDVMSHVHVPGYAPFPFYPVMLDAGTAVSFSNWSGTSRRPTKRISQPCRRPCSRYGTAGRAIRRTSQAAKLCFETCSIVSFWCMSSGI